MVNMWTRFLYLLGILIIVGVSHFLVGLVSNEAIVPIAGGIECLLAYGFWKLVESSARSFAEVYLPGIIAIAGIFLGGIFRSLIKPEGVYAWKYEAMAIFIAILVCWIITTRLSRKYSQGCQICKKALSNDYEQCPRCQHAVCRQRSCWNDDSYRCADCERIRTPWLSLEDDLWWTDRIGSRVSFGECFRCRKPASDLDLRKCGRCPRAMCTRCWDMENGLCVKCGWVMPNLPEPLQQWHQANDELQA
jgi:hypothetical protein